MEEWTGRINADYNSREDPVQNGGLGLTFEEQLGSQNTVMKRKCIPSRRLLSPPRARTRPPGFPALELSDPLVFYLEASLADSIFGPDHARIPETEWMSQALLIVDTVNPGNLVEITIFGQSIVQNWVKSLLLSLASCHPEHRARVAKMEQPEEFLKALASRPGSPASCCISIVRSIMRTVVLQHLKFKSSKYSQPLHSFFLILDG
ncbi:oocyte-expressed protein homolog [Equus quagga]|uniref:oocyte-expressed protein homolog n=1 Tax=Equus quagga TaxID=89248 RepID=UPI001EE39941|nr:oocyte-expressed protein homolog [Equus quagga]